MDSSDCRISHLIKATNWGRLWNQLLASMPCRYWYKLFYIFVNVGFQSSETMIPQFVGFHQWKSCKVRNFSYNLQSEEEGYFYSNSSDSRIFVLWKPTKWGIYLITSNLRKFNLAFILGSDSSDCSILLLKKHAKWGIFFDILQSEEFAIFNAIRHSSYCRISCMIKATIWGRLWNQLLVSMSYRYWYKLFYTFVVVIF